MQVRIRKKRVNGQEYYYLEESLRLDKPKVYSVFIGRGIPVKPRLKQLELQLADKIYGDLLDGASRIYLTKGQLIEAEKRRRRYDARAKMLGRAARDEKEEFDTVNFVYTTLTTEGVPITMEDARLAYAFSGKNVKSLRDENLRVALDMIRGIRQVRESRRGLSEAFILKLHGTVMAEYPRKWPGAYRKRQAYIYLKSYEKAEEIAFRPVGYKDIRRELRGLVSWYNSNLGRLNAIELASLLHLRFYKIHPFEDGNKRVSRLLINKAFNDLGYPMLNISKQTQAYFDALVQSAEGKNEKPFVEFVYKRFIEDI